MSYFLNVDLDVEAAEDPEPFLAALDERVLVLRSDRAPPHLVCLELSRVGRDLEATAVDLCTVLELLPAAARAWWDRASLRDFNVGIQAATGPEAAEFLMGPPTLARMAALGVRLVLTVYAPDPVDAPASER
ncbi:MAG: hypothetical protein IT373_34795 [Polyangiaceae bacterium]|nr:hypothetical protein [Polyangiaceae bacterium]